MSVVGATVSFAHVVAFADFSAEFSGGQVTALVGPSGSGKSTLLAAIAGYQHLASGQVKIYSGEDDVGHSPLPEFVAWVPQGANAMSRRSVLDNVLIAPLAAGMSMSDALDVSRAALEMVGLSAHLHDQARLLSGGELQRVSIARALASQKELILADEPSANLDARNTVELANILGNLKATSTVIVATHDPLLVAASHSTVHMRDDLALHA